MMHEQTFAVKSAHDHADDRCMSALVRRRTPAFVVAIALTATAAVFAFARPSSERYEGETLDMRNEHVYSLAEVRRAFARHGLPLRYDANLRALPRGVATLGSTPRRTWTVDAFYVYYAGAEATVDWGDPAFAEGRYEERFGNLLVHDGGNDASVRARVEAAVAELR
jgi:hypothetical protein